MSNTEDRQLTQTYSLLGGPLHRLGCRLRLVRGGTSTLPLGVALGLLLWIVLVALALIEGVGQQVFSLEVISGHARLLLVIPLFFLCESTVDPQLTEFVRYLVRSGVVPAISLPALEREVASTRRWQESWLPEAICLVAAVLLSLGASSLPLPGSTAAVDPGRAAAGLTLTGWWYWVVCLTVFRFLLFRWLWRLVLWCRLLWRLSRMELHLVPTHPDGVAGLGFLEVVVSDFAPLILSISVLESASFAEDIVAGRMSVDAAIPGFAVVLAVNALLFLGPLLLFAPRLWRCRAQGLSAYMALASRYVNDFERKWLGRPPPTEPLLGTPDLQSLADFSSSVEVVRRMRWTVVNPHMLLVLTATVLLPMLPLLLLKYPVGDLVEKLFLHLVGA